MTRTDSSPAGTPLAQPTARTLPAPAAQPGAPTLIGSVQRAMRLLETAARHTGGAPAKQLAREAGLALPTAYHLLRTLVHEGYLRREQGVFVLGSAAERLGSGAAAQSRRARIGKTLDDCCELLGVPLYFAVYRQGEIEVVSVAERPGYRAVEEWADFRATAHAHALGQCLLSQLDPDARRDHLDRYPVQALTPYTVRDERTLLARLERVPRMQPVTERQEYAVGTVCAAIPITAGATAAAVALSLPAHQARRLAAVSFRLGTEIGRVVGSLSFSISI
ncbi:IclR family transcriptional regulator [Streptomyces physcomitrii]